MYAIIQAGGKQFRVGVGDEINVDSLGEQQEGAEVNFDVLFVNDGDKTHIGAPSLSDFVVKGEYVAATLGPKVVAYKYKRRKRQSIKKGHRQQYSKVKITGISARKEK